MYDHLIVGSGLFGAVFAHEAKAKGKSCLVLERRGHIGGMCTVRRKMALIFTGMVLISFILHTRRSNGPGRLGFSHVVNAADEDLGKMVRENTEGRGADACVEGTGESEALAECINLAKAGGTVVCVGLPRGEMNLSESTYQEIRRKELTVAGVWRGE